MSEPRESNAVLIGRKPAMNYVLACITLFHGNAPEIKVKARTRELSELNKTLEEKVKERTAELQERIEELNKFFFQRRHQITNSYMKRCSTSYIIKK
mgnify:CR=1 FL=1